MLWTSSFLARLSPRRSETKPGSTTGTEELLQRNVACSTEQKRTTLPPAKRNAEAKQSYNQADKQARRRYNTKLKENPDDKTLTSKKWWRIVNTLSGRTAHSDIPVIEY
jgi:hypothetical protein